MVIINGSENGLAPNSLIAQTRNSYVVKGFRALIVMVVVNDLAVRTISILIIIKNK